jgi:DNA recombination protein RmuC
VSDVYINETKERAALSIQLENLHKLNIQMSEEANNLTRALRIPKLRVHGELILEYSENRPYKRQGICSGDNER